MAIIKDYIHPSGARVIVADDFAAKPGTAEYRRVMQGIMRAAEAILIDAAKTDGEGGCNHGTHAGHIPGVSGDRGAEHQRTD